MSPASTNTTREPCRRMSAVEKSNGLSADVAFGPFMTQSDIPYGTANVRFRGCKCEARLPQRAID